MQPLFHGVVLGGQLKLSKGETQVFKKYLLTLEGKEVQLTVERQKDQRTLNQNAYLWGVCYKLICDYTGDDPESFHEWAKDKFLGKKTIIVRGEERQVTRSTTELDKYEYFDVYVDPLIRWASIELGVVVPYPNEVSV